MPGVGTTRPSVIERARGGDASEFARLYAPLTFAMGRKLGLGEHDAEDVMQQTMLEVLGLLPAFEYDRRRGSFKGLLKKIVRNRTVDWLRRRRSSAAGELERVADAADAFERMFEREWQKAHLRAALERVRTEVKPTTFQSFQLCALCEWSVDEVAGTLGLTPNQVCQNKRRVIRRLRAHVEELQGESA